MATAGDLSDPTGATYAAYWCWHASEEFERARKLSDGAVKTRHMDKGRKSLSFAADALGYKLVKKEGK